MGDYSPVSTSPFYTTIASDQLHKYHPLFAEEDATIIITSSDGVHYRMHPFILRTTSGFFRDMISLPRHGGVAESYEDHITLNERGKILENLLRIISGFGVLQWESLDELEDVLAAAQKYDMPGPQLAIRSVIRSGIFLKTPLRLYAIAACYGWEEEAKIASKLSLDMSIYDDEHTAILERIPTSYILRLFRLHRDRRNQFRKHVSRDNGCFGIQTCADCNRAVKNSGLEQLMNLIIWEMDQRPAGSDLVEGIWKKWPAYKSEPCQCGRSKTFVATVYGEKITEDIRACLKVLPSTI